MTEHLCCTTNDIGDICSLIDGHDGPCLLRGGEYPDLPVLAGWSKWETSSHELEMQIWTSERNGVWLAFTDLGEEWYGEAGIGLLSVEQDDTPVASGTTNGHTLAHLLLVLLESQVDLAVEALAGI